MKFIGFDYSMSSPAMCVLGEDGVWANSTTYYLTDKKKYQGVFSTQRGFQVIGDLHPLYKTQQQRFENIAAHFIKHLSFHTTLAAVAIEDYSMGSKGKVFHIAENTGILKYLLWKYGYDFKTIPPTVIKKFATGKGNAKKEQMFEAFIKDTGSDLSKIMGQDGKLDSPITDVVDAYYIARYAKVIYEQNLGRPQTVQT